jgi:hypothetical protein
MKLFSATFLLAFSLTMFSSVYAQHSVQVDDGAGNISTIVAPSTPATFKLPTNTGTAGQVLTSDGAGGTSFQPAGNFTPSFLYEYSINFFGGLFVPAFGNVPFFNLGNNTGTAFTVGPFGAITINETGLYQVDFSISLGNFAPLGGGVTLSQNGIQILGTQYTPQQNAAIQGMAYLNLNAGDIITVVNANGLAINLGGLTFGLNSVVASLRMARVQ